MLILGWEPWSSGYGRIFMFKYSWVRIPVPNIEWKFFTFDAAIVLFV